MCKFAKTVRIATLLFSLASVLRATVLAQTHDPALQERFLTGVSQAAQKLEQISLRAACVSTSRFVFDPLQPSTIDPTRQAELAKPTVIAFECAVRGRLSMQSGLSKTGNRYFRVRNQVYAFAIERALGTNRTSLQFVEELGVQPSVDAKVAELEEYVRSTALAAFHVRGTSLSDLVTNRSFKIRRVYPVKSEGGELVRVEFDNVEASAAVNPSNQHLSNTYTDNFLVCDPQRDWCLTEYGGLMHNHISKEDSVLHVTLGFGSPVNGIPVANRIEFANSSPKTPGTSVEGVHEVEFTDEDVPEEEFYLTHYGLPEPNFSRSANSKWVVYLIGGVACIGIGVILIKRRSGRVGTS